MVGVCEDERRRGGGRAVGRRRRESEREWRAGDNDTKRAAGDTHFCYMYN
jgi:hypothetical protein